MRADGAGNGWSGRGTRQGEKISLRAEEFSEFGYEIRLRLRLESVDNPLLLAVITTLIRGDCGSDTVRYRFY